MKISLVPFASLAGIGLVASAIVHVGALFGMSNPLGVADAILHVNLSIVLLVTIIIGNRLLQKDGPKRIWSVFWRGCPLWMRRLVYVLLAYFVLATLYNMVTTIGEPNVSTFKSVSGGFFAIYTMVFAILYPASRLDINLYPAQCPYGHPMPFLDMRCETCAQTSASPGENHPPSP